MNDLEKELQNLYIETVRNNPDTCKNLTDIEKLIGESILVKFEPNRNKRTSIFLNATDDGKILSRPTSGKGCGNYWYVPPRPLDNGFFPIFPCKII